MTIEQECRSDEDLEAVLAVYGDLPRAEREARKRRQAQVAEECEEGDVGTRPYDPYEDLPEVDVPAAEIRRRDEVRELRRQIQVLQGRIENRDHEIGALRAKVRRLEGLVARQRPVIVAGGIKA